MCFITRVQLRWVWLASLFGGEGCSLCTVGVFRAALWVSDEMARDQRKGRTFCVFGAWILVNHDQGPGGLE